ncbi:MAG: terminase small subunit [Oscillospiraceae bacterium]|jgi:hypothetical protein|nr:terminase small subunit [Oscillospiraceae bacterium]
MTQAETVFCRLFAESRDLRSAAVKAGIDSDAHSGGVPLPPESAGYALLARADIRREITRWEKFRQAQQSELLAGVRRLAFGSVTDAVRLVLGTEVPSAAEIERMDLFNVSEIKRPREGALEIKFFDRLKALELLSTLRTADDAGALSGFLKAMTASAKEVE